MELWLLFHSGNAMAVSAEWVTARNLSPDARNDIRPELRWFGLYRQRSGLQYHLAWISPQSSSADESLRKCGCV
ncbi:hypothetical protein H4582DRAFT_1904455, partial [Lactarius indigo]